MMSPLFCVRFTLLVDRRPGPADVLSADYPGPLADLPGLLPPGAHVLSIENLVERRSVHWTRWPAAIRPGTKNEGTGRIMI